MRITLVPCFWIYFTAAAIGGAGIGTASAQSSTSVSQEKKKTGAHRCKAWASPSYNRMLRNWRKAPEIPKPKYRDGYRDLTIYAVNLGKRIRVFPYLSDGSVDPAVVEEIEFMFQDKDSGAKHSLNPRLIKLLYKLAEHFQARQINVISAYRESSEWENGSNHSMGRAVDFMIPGVALGALARKARRLGHVGVGFYPVSGFVHLDVREGPSFFWVDRSGPGFASCLRRMEDKAAAKVDYRWKPEDDEAERRVDRKGVLLGATQPPIEQGGSETPPEQYETPLEDPCDQKSEIPDWALGF